MSCTTAPPKEQARYQEDRTFIQNLLENLLSNSQITSEPGLPEDLTSIAKQAYFTTFPGDYDPSPDGIRLSKLAKYPRDKVTTCLNQLMQKGNRQIRDYVREYKENY